MQNNFCILNSKRPDLINHKPYSIVNMKVDLEKNFDKNVFDTIKTTILCTFIWKKPIKIGFGQNLLRNFL